MKQSIRNRLLVTTTCVLAAFLTSTAWVLEQSFRDSVLSGAEEQLRQVIYAVMGAVEESEGQLLVTSDLAEPRLMQSESGLYARVADDLGNALWLSLSAGATDVSFPAHDGEPGDFVFQEDPTGTHIALSYTVFWEGVDPERVTFAALADLAPLRREINQFRRSLGFGLGLATLFFIIAQLVALRWGLRPLRTMAREVQALEAGERERLSNGYPAELQGLARNLDRFVEHEQRSRSRYRNALDDLAHSLKTPLAVVRNALGDAAPDRHLLSEQLERMESTVTHQLTRASARGPVVVGKAVPLGGLVARLVHAVERAYADRGITAALTLDDAAVVRGDERDFMEIFGNLIENAFKYTAGRVAVTVTAEGTGATCVIEDDGPGIPEALREEALARGKRLDEMQAGQGIGLAMVSELVALYSGRLDIEASELGGARLVVWLA